MGLGPKISSGETYMVNPVNPNPHLFKIIQIEQFDNCYMSVINYPNCTNFEGNKILITTWDPRNRISIDPHFSSGYGLIARFEPSPEGSRLARLLASQI